MHALLVSLLARLPARIGASKTPWTIRALRPGDAPAMQAFVDGLTASSRRLRFHGAVGRCSVRLAEALVAGSAAGGGAVFGAFVEVDGVPRLVGEARWMPGHAAEAELAIAIADDWQGRGLAAALLAAVQASARAAGMRVLVANVLAENPRMPRFLERLGYAQAAASGGGLVYRQPIAPALAPSAPQRIRDALAAIAAIGSIAALDSITLPPDDAGPHDAAPVFALTRPFTHQETSTMSLLDLLIARPTEQRRSIASTAPAADRVTAICIDLASFGVCALMLLGPILGWI